METQPESTPSLAEVAAFLSRHLSRPTTVLGARRAFPGLSRETWLVRASVDGAETGFVLRLEHPWGGPVPASLEVEYAVYRRLWEAGHPVAEPLWCGTDADFLHGRPHLVRRLVEGSSQVPGLREQSAAGEALRERVVFSHLDALADLHTFDWRAAGLDDVLGHPPAPDQVLRTEFDTWRRRWLAGRTGPRPIVTEFLCWLEPHVPTDVHRISLTKGNNGVGEEIFRAGRLVALSDFELSALSDGVLDLAFTQGTLGLVDQSVALRRYEERSGLTVPPARLAYAQLWNRFKALVNLELHFAVPFIAGTDQRTAAVTFGLVGVSQLERSMARWIDHDFVDVVDRLADTGSGLYG